jgi:hypothetical protein
VRVSYKIGRHLELTHGNRVGALLALKPDPDMRQVQVKWAPMACQQRFPLVAEGASRERKPLKSLRFTVPSASI